MKVVGGAGQDAECEGQYLCRVAGMVGWRREEESSMMRRKKGKRECEEVR
jgi:hypothetical protein